MPRAEASDAVFGALHAMAIMVGVEYCSDLDRYARRIVEAVADRLEELEAWNVDIDDSHLQRTFADVIPGKPATILKVAAEVLLVPGLQPRESLPACANRLIDATDHEIAELQAMKEALFRLLIRLQSSPRRHRDGGRP